MRSTALVLAGALLLALLVAVPGANAQVTVPYGYYPTAPFYMPQMGVDPFGRPYTLQIAGAYGPFDGFGYPVVVNTVGFYGGLPIARTSLRYVPAAVPFAPYSFYGAPVAVPLLP